MKKFHFNYFGKVRGQGRPRFTRNGHAYENKADKDYKEAIAAAFVEQGGTSFGDCALTVYIDVFRALPESKKRKRIFVSEQDTFKPDADNIGKAVLDALNGLAWEDDSQIISLHVTKFCRRPMKDNLDEMRVGIYESKF